MDAILNSAASAIMATMGTAAIFTPSGGDAVSIQVIFDVELEYQVDGFDARAAGRTRTVEAMLSDLGQVPARGDTFFVSSATYTVTHIIENDERFVKAAVK